MIFTIAMIGVAVFVLAFTAFRWMGRREVSVGDTVGGNVPASTPMQVAKRPEPFFISGGTRGEQRPLDDASIALLMSILEGHVRCEQAAVDSFLRKPTVERLQSNTTSPLAN